MERIEVAHVQGDRFAVSVRGHVLVVDQPESAGGTDTGPTPTELFVAGLAACVAFYARRYLVRHALPEQGLAVSALAETASRPSRVGRVTVTVTVPDGVPDDQRAALLAVASHCTVHNTLQTPPEVVVELARGARPGRAQTGSVG